MRLVCSPRHQTPPIMTSLHTPCFPIFLSPYLPLYPTSHDTAPPITALPHVLGHISPTHTPVMPPHTPVTPTPYISHPHPPATHPHSPHHPLTPTHHTHPHTSPSPSSSTTTTLFYASMTIGQYSFEVRQEPLGSLTCCDPWGTGRAAISGHLCRALVLPHARRWPP